MKLGEIEKVTWYQFEDDEDNWYTFHKAFLDGDRTRSLILRSDQNQFASQIANENKISYSFMRNANREEVEEWLLSQEDLVVVATREI